MVKHYRKGRNINRKTILRLMSFGALLIGVILFFYTFFPIISWQVYFAPAFATQEIQSPIANSVLFRANGITNLLANAASGVTTDYSNAYNWYPGSEHPSGQSATYKISFPSIGISNADVTNVNGDLTRHLVQFNSDTFPPKAGNTIIFGHSTLPQLYDPKNYKTIFANAYKLKVGEEIIVTNQGKQYNYRIESITVVEPTDTSVLAQDFSDSFLTIITCTPPGTIWKRLIVKARIER